MFAHKVLGPLSVLKQDLEQSTAPRNVIEHVNGFRRRLFLAWKLAGENLGRAQGRMKKHFDRRAVERVFSPGDQVLALLPVPGSLFCAKFVGPYSVMRQVTERDYLLATPGRKRSTQLCRINLLKRYHIQSVSPGLSGEQVKSAAVAAVDCGPVSPHLVAVDEDMIGPDDAVLRPRLKNSETLGNLDSLLNHLPSEGKAELKEMILSYDVLFSDNLSCTDILQNDVDVGDAQPIRKWFYRVAPLKQTFLDAEVKYLLDHGLAKPSHSSWCSPCLLVSKPDNTYRFCTDYRKVNKVTKPD